MRIRQITAKLDDSDRYDVFWIDDAKARVKTKIRDEDGNVWIVMQLWGACDIEDLDGMHASWKYFSDRLK